MIGFGNQVTTNSAACSTGTESIFMACERIREGKADIMLAGSCDSFGPYIWGGFDSMRVLNRTSNGEPEKASRPMSASAEGFIPGAGAGALVLEEREHALARGAKIYAEVLGGHVNAGGQRNGGTMTAPNSKGVVRCVQKALEDAKLRPEQVDAVCGHLTSTMGDVLEIKNWSEALGRKGNDFPFVNSLKSLIGHCLAAAGSIETVAAVLQLQNGFFHANRNIEDLHPGIASAVDPSRIPVTLQENTGFSIIGKSSFGFGDVNACLFLKKAE
jgi:3-oxoacyl-(acyl-carrier-protein) synthase